MRVLSFLAASLAALLAIGCAPAIEADLSADGRTVVYGGPSGLFVRETSQSKPRRVLAGTVDSPRLSPDGRTVVLERPGDQPQTVLVSLADDKATPIKGPLGGPYAWRPDGSELIGWRGATGHVYHLGSRSIVRQVELPASPTRVRWIPGGRDLVAATEENVYVVRNGRVRALPAGNRITDVAYDPSERRVVWAEVRQIGELDARIDTFAAPIDGGPVQPLMRDIAAADLTGSSGPYAVPITLAVSPDGRNLAIAAFVEPAPAGNWKRYADLSKKHAANPKDKAVKAELDRLSRRLEFEVALATTPLTGGESTVVRRFTDEEFPDLPHDLVWSPDSARLALVTHDDVKVVKP